MGLGFANADAHWSYGGFNLFRTALAAREGIELDRMHGFTRDDDAISWDTVHTALKPFLNHSDCDGEMTPEECAQVAPRLRDLVRSIWRPGDYDYEHGMCLVEGMERAAANGEPLIFC